MKKLITIIVAIIIALTLVNFQCNDNIVDPPPGNPPGYQADIPWPSLANSPWPMNHGDPQSTGRSDFVGPMNGIIANKITAQYVLTGIALGKDSTLYFATSHPGELQALTYNGELKWKLQVALEITNTPLISSDGTIYITTGALKELLAVRPDGNIKWRFRADNETYNASINIGLNGYLYFIDNSSTLYAIDKDGKLKWKLTDNRFISGVAAAPTFSPDGKTLYLQGIDIMVLALDIETRSVKWTYGEGKLRSSPIVDAQGNLYLNPFTDSNGESIFYSIDSRGQLRWFYRYYSDFRTIGHIEPSIDKYGNIYFGYDTLFALNYNGQLKWKYGFNREENEIIISPIICDNLCNIYVGIVGFSDPKILSINSNGNLNWELTVEGERSPGGSPAINDNGVMFYPMWNSNSIIIIK